MDVYDIWPEAAQVPCEPPNGSKIPPLAGMQGYDGDSPGLQALTKHPFAVQAKDDGLNPSGCS